MSNDDDLLSVEKQGDPVGEVPETSKGEVLLTLEKTEDHIEVEVQAVAKKEDIAEDDADEDNFFLKLKVLLFGEDQDAEYSPFNNQDDPADGDLNFSQGEGQSSGEHKVDPAKVVQSPSKGKGQPSVRRKAETPPFFAWLVKVFDNKRGMKKDGEEMKPDQAEEEDIWKGFREFFHVDQHKNNSPQAAVNSAPPVVCVDAFTQTNVVTTNLTLSIPSNRVAGRPGVPAACVLKRVSTDLRTLQQSASVPMVNQSKIISILSTATTTPSPTPNRRLSEAGSHVAGPQTPKVSNVNSPVITPRVSGANTPDFVREEHHVAEPRSSLTLQTVTELQSVNEQDSVTEQPNAQQSVTEQRSALTPEVSLNSPLGLPSLPMPPLTQEDAAVEPSSSLQADAVAAVVESEEIGRRSFDNNMYLNFANDGGSARSSHVGHAEAETMTLNLQAEISTSDLDKSGILVVKVVLPESDDAVQAAMLAQVEDLLAGKAKLMAENENLRREILGLRELLEYTVHQLPPTAEVSEDEWNSWLYGPVHKEVNDSLVVSGSLRQCASMQVPSVQVPIVQRLRALKLGLYSSIRERAPPLSAIPDSPSGSPLSTSNLKAHASVPAESELFLHNVPEGEHADEGEGLFYEAAKAASTDKRKAAIVAEEAVNASGSVPLRPQSSNTLSTEKLNEMYELPKFSLRQSETFKRFMEKLDTT